jgi:hypothetical protein
VVAGQRHADQQEAEMRRTTPDLVGTRKTIYSYVSIGLLALTIAYVLWANYIVFVGGNLPLTSISLGDGSTGAGLTMLFVGDLIAVIVLWFVVDAVLLSLLHMVLRAGNPAAPTTVAPQGQQQWEAQQWQQPGQPQQWQPQQQWQQPGQPQQWPPQAQQQQQWPQGQPQQQWPQERQQQQWQPQAWPSTPPPAAPPASTSPGDVPGQATLVTQNPVVQDAYGVNEAAPTHRHWTPPPAR